MHQSNKYLLKKLFKDSFSMNKKNYFIAMIMMLIVALCTAGTAFILGKIIDVLSGINTEISVSQVSLAILLLFAIRGFASYFQVVSLARAGASIIYEKQLAVFNHLLKLDLGFFTSNGSSDLLLRITKSVSQARRVIEIIVIGFMKDLVTLIGLMAVMIYQQPVLSLICLIIGPVTIYGMQKIQSSIKDLMRQENEGSRQLIKTIQETSNGNREIKAFGLEPYLTKKMTKTLVFIQNRTNKMVRKTAATMPLMDVTAGIAISSVVLFSEVHIGGFAPGSPGELVSFVTAFLMAYEPAKKVARFQLNFTKNMVGVEMLYGLLEQEVILSDPKDGLELENKCFDLEFDNVSFNYPDDTSALSNVSFIIPKGKMISFVGPSGSGKSTILNLLLRFYDPSSGKVTIDGLDLKNITFESLRRNISYVGQESFLFDGSIKENIMCGKEDASNSDLINALKFSGLYDFVELLPNGINTQIGENGATLSGGQKQRIAIARAIVSNGSLIIIDEATSALDSATELGIRNSFKKIKGKKTVVAVAHRLSTILDSDYIYYIENGEITEHGTLETLLTKDQKFKRLYDQYYSKEVYS